MRSKKAQIPETVEVNLGARSYPIIIGSGLLADAAALIQPYLRRPKLAIITDESLVKHHLPKLEASLKKAAIDHAILSVPPGEASKNFAQLERLTGWLLEQKIDRHDIVIALGGGVIGDLTGFAAAILRRGTRFVQIPTTLLAQVDSSIGGKTAINMPVGKNLIGAFHQPDLVIIDMDVLATLAPRELCAGYAEVVKYGALGNAAFFDWLQKNGDKVLALEPQALAYAIGESCRTKATLVARDERETGARALLNLGHTFGHAFEKLCGLNGDLLHGEAIATGMVMAFDFSVTRGHCPRQDGERLRTVLDAARLPTDMTQIDDKGFAAAISS